MARAGVSGPEAKGGAQGRPVGAPRHAWAISSGERSKGMDCTMRENKPQTICIWVCRFSGDPHNVCCPFGVQLKKKKKKKKTRPRLARKQNIASEVGPTLQDAFFFPTRSIREASARQHQARCSAQTGRCKLVCASCSTQVALCKLLCASCSAQVALASWSLQVAPCKLLCANCAPCKLLCASCSVQVALCKLLCASCSA